MMAGDDLRDSTFVVVAAGSGVGSRVAQMLAARGARLVLTSREPAALARLAADVNGQVLTADAASFADVERSVAAAVAAPGRLAGVVNCAGSLLLKPAHLTSAQELQDVLAANLVSAFATVRAGAGAMRSSGGSIVLVSSAAGAIGLPNHEAIAAAKAGVSGLMRSAAATYAPYGIRVNAVAPGLVDTPMSRAITANELARNASVAMHPLGRLGTPDDIAEAVCWLLGPQSAWVTGQVLGVDGGLATLKSRVKTDARS
jgi:NAD(P)-dependent dehydrogenase (short-subunit alcohol dehydrogenase family)